MFDIKREKEYIKERSLIVKENNIWIGEENL